MPLPRFFHLTGRAATNNPRQLLQSWLRDCVPRFFPGVIAIVMVLRIFLVLNIFVRTQDFIGNHGRFGYSIGVLFSFSHLIVAPLMLRYERKLTGEENLDGEEVEKLIRGWLSVNNIRIWVVDVAFWVWMYWTVIYFLHHLLVDYIALYALPSSPHRCHPESPLTNKPAIIHTFPIRPAFSQEPRGIFEYRVAGPNTWHTGQVGQR